MGLTGAGFVVLLAIAALGAVAACVRLLPRFSGSGPGPLAARAVLVVATQVLLLSALAVLVNSDMRFYSSWGDLFDANAGTVRVLDRSTAAPASAPPVPPAVATARGALARTLPAGEGRLDVLDVRGTRSGISAHAYVYLPPQYAHGDRRPFPVVLFLASPNEAIGRQRLPELVARQIAAGRLRPMLIVVVPSRPGCVDVPGGRQGETFFSEDLPAAVTAAYHVGRAASDWSVAGPGAAGYCAALLAMRHSDRFGSAVFSASALAPPPGDLYGGSRSIRDEYDPVWRLRHRPPAPISAGVVADDGFAAGARPPMRAEPLPATAWQNLPLVFRWLDAHLTPGSQP